MRMAKKKKKIDFRSAGKKHENKVSWISIADVEIANIKKARLTSDSLYYKNVFVDYATSNCGFRKPVISDEDRIGAHEEWLEAYRHFCRQTVNTKGKKVNRKHLQEINYNCSTPQ